MIEITRESGIANRLRPYVVLIDDKSAGDIADGETKHFDVKPGNHTVRLKLDWTTLARPKLRVSVHGIAA